MKYYFKHKKIFHRTIFVVEASDVNVAFARLKLYFFNKFKIKLSSDEIEVFEAEVVEVSEE